MSDLLKERVIRPISTQELERRWKAVREVMKAKKIDFLLVQNNNDYLGVISNGLRTCRRSTPIPVP